MIINQLPNGDVALSSDGLAMEVFKKINKLKNSSDVLKYIYYMHDPDSRYASMLPNSRDILIRREMIKTNVDVNDKLINDAIESYKAIRTDPKFMLLEGVKQKIEEYVEWWKNTKITEDNHDVVNKSLINAQKLLTIKKSLEDEIYNTNKAKEYGGGQARIFESE